MPPPSRPRSPLWIVVLGLACEEPMHPYRMQTLIKQRGKDLVANVARREPSRAHTLWSDRGGTSDTAGVGATRIVHAGAGVPGIPGGAGDALRSGRHRGLRGVVAPARGSAAAAARGAQASAPEHSS